MERYICIHAHFYQPPRENPWLEAIEIQDSAYPYHDWNERITAECYASNSASRNLDNEGRILDIVSNYSPSGQHSFHGWKQMLLKHTRQYLIRTSRALNGVPVTVMHWLKSTIISSCHLPTPVISARRYSGG